MKTILKGLCIIALVLLALPGRAGAEDKVAVQKTEDHTTGYASITGRAIDGERSGAKFEEYREVNEISADMNIVHEPDRNHTYSFDGYDIGLHDQTLRLEASHWGKWRAAAGFNEIPHRFAYDTTTLFGGVGTGDLTFPLGFRQLSQNSGAAQTAALLAQRLSFLQQSAGLTDLQYFRERSSFDIDVTAWNPFNLRLGFRNEDRHGVRPFTGSFGFGSTLDLGYPVDMDTQEFRATADYTHKDMHWSAAYYSSDFDNNVSTLTFDNPFRFTDATAANAYQQTNLSGAARGRIDLDPSNRFHNFTLTSSYGNLPWNSRLTTVASWGQMKQNDPFLPYTTNTAIVRGAPASVPAGTTAPFDAFLLSNLPAQSLNGKVDTTTYNVNWAVNPTPRSRYNAQYKYYKYDVKTPELTFPGFVAFDAQWLNEEEENKPETWRDRELIFDAAYDVSRFYTVTLTYANNETTRENREVADQDENVFRVQLDRRSPWLDIRSSLEHATRRGNYDFAVPFDHVIPNGQHPLLRKYDEANRNRDKFHGQATVQCTEKISLTPQVTLLEDEYPDSFFGLKNSTTRTAGIEADIEVNAKTNVNAYFNREFYTFRQMIRQWNPAPGVSDPYITEPQVASNSNHVEDHEDKGWNLGFTASYQIRPKKDDVSLSYQYTENDGQMAINSPIGVAGVNDNNAFVPTGWDRIDDTKAFTLHLKYTNKASRDWMVTAGAWTERLIIRDYNKDGYSPIPLTTAGAFNGGILGGTLPQGYDVDVVYLNGTYKF